MAPVSLVYALVLCYFLHPQPLIFANTNSGSVRISDHYSRCKTIARFWKNSLRFLRSRVELAVTGKTAWDGPSRSPAHAPQMGIDDDTVFHTSYLPIVDAVYSRVFQGMIDQARIRKSHFLARRVVVHWALESQLQIPLPHADNAELRPGVKEPERVFGKTSYRFASGCNHCSRPTRSVNNFRQVKFTTVETVTGFLTRTNKSERLQSFRWCCQSPGREQKRRRSGFLRRQ